MKEILQIGEPHELNREEQFLYRMAYRTENDQNLCTLVTRNWQPVSAGMA